MNSEIYHNNDAREELIALILENNPVGFNLTDIETAIDRLVASAVDGASKSNDGTCYAETIGARVTAHHEDECGHNHFYVEYHYNTNTGTAFDYSEYKPVEHAVEVEENDPELIVGMIADEGF